MPYIFSEIPGMIFNSEVTEEKNIITAPTYNTVFMEDKIEAGISILFTEVGISPERSTIEELRLKWQMRNPLKNEESVTASQSMKPI